ncbi:glycosyltransferase family 4 protein [Bradyrhizobium erythrophlei]|uniref:Glycosyltransferase involved in cell wall bisynthesis n=1 Tax=Bradyrhizobium erythrophlei TaxID=1437360 RepID=A0A1M5TEI9_9BRAD|nr:glycosyltransferase family 4 protein [Bradyrhizobium erythrophlei]SHH49126.1 Glycosyltransferase involved in cell wall bisynthesis [Bradyrhizobium erythrophlei]
MRIAYLINQYPKISHTFIRREIRALERQDIDVTRIAIRGWDAEVLDEDDKSEQLKTRYVLRDGAARLLTAALAMALSHPVQFYQGLGLAFRMSRSSDRPLLLHLAYLAEACRIQPWLIQERIEHLHAHFGTNSAEVAMLTHALGGPAWSFTVHGPEEFDKPQSIGLPEKIRRCAFVIAISSFGRSQLFRLVGHSLWPKIHVVRCGLDRAFHQGAASPSPMTRNFVCVGRLCEQKGQLLLIDAARRLLERGEQFSLTFAGDGELRPELEGLIDRYNLRNNIRITGWLSSEQVRQELLSARALVLPSFAEGLPVVIMEAMAVKRPVISTFVAGIPELVKHGQNGWLVAAGDVGKLADAMQECLATSPEVLERMGEAGFEAVTEHHNVDKEAELLAGIFRRPSRSLPELH